MKSPLDEIFKSLGSLQEELNEQNKVNVKQKNLEKVKQFLLERKGFLDEDVTSGNVTVYHRTGRKYGDSSVKGIAADGYTVGNGADYGIGVYTTYDLESQLRENMVKIYGNIIIESKVISLDKFLIFDYDVAKKIYGNVNYTLDNQLRLILGKNWNDFKNNNFLKELIEEVTVVKYTSDIAKTFYEQFEQSIVKSLRGIVFTGRNDGKVLISYDRKNVEPLRYTTDEGKNWNNIINKNIYKRLKRYNPEESETNIEHMMNKLDLNFNLYKNEKNFIINNIDKFIMKLDIDTIKKKLLNISEYSEANDKIIQTLLTVGGKNFIDNLGNYGIIDLILHSTLLNRDKITENILSIGGKEFINKLDYNNIISLIIRSTKENQNKIIEILLTVGGKEFINKLNYDMIDTILYFAQDKDKIKQILQQYGKLPKEETTPMNEIFKSLTSLQEELTEQRNVTIKESNLMKVQNFFKNRKNNQ
jgi:hypothetical protein